MDDQKTMASPPVMPMPAAGAPVPPPSYYEASAGYPPQPGAYPSQPGVYPPQPGYGPGPSAPPQAGYGMAPPPGPGGYAPVPTMPMPPGAMPGVPMPTVVQPGATVVVVQQAVYFRDHSVVATCPRCQQSVQTVTSTQNGALTWLICVLLCFFCPIIFCLPFCVDGMKDVVHRCPHCRTRMGTYTRL